MTNKIKANIGAHQQVVEALLENGTEMISKIASCIADAIGAGGKVLIAGNGGSAADAQHIAGELVGRFLCDRRPFPAVALSTDTSVITSVANDYDFDHVFVRQVDALTSPGDVFWTLSTSGNSPNVVLAAESAKKRGATVIAFTGRDGGRLGKLADLTLAVPADRTDRIQEAHMIAYHIICELVEESLCG